MQELWSTELSPEETERLLRSAATEVRKRKMEVPAILFAEIHKPLANIASQTAIVLSPFLVPFFGFQRFNDYSRLLSRRENWDRLIEMLEEDGSPAKDQEA